MSITSAEKADVVSWPNSDLRCRPRCRVRLLLVAVALCLPTISGCGGCGSSMNFPTEEEAAKAREINGALSAMDNAVAPKQKPAEPTVPKPAPPAPTAVVQKSVATVAKKILAEAEEPSRPKDVAAWKRDDYYSAKRDGDPRLVDAVRHLGEHFSSSEKAAELLARLLDASPDDPFAGASEEAGSRSPAAGRGAKATEAIVAALAANTTPKARQTLQRMVDGDLKTADGQPAASLVLKALLSQPREENEDLFLRILTMPAEAAMDDRTAAAWDKTRGVAIAAIAKTASESLRVRLAEAMIAPDTSPAIYDQLWVALKQPRPENLLAQMVIYQSDRPDEKARALLEQSFAVQSGEAMSGLLGIRPARRQETKSAKDVGPFDPNQVAGCLWSADFSAALEQRLLAIEALAKDAKLVELASTIPNPSARAALLRLLERHWDQGPRGLKVSGSSQHLTKDPGFIVLLKLLPNRDALTATGPHDMAKVVAVGVASGRNSGPSSARTSQIAPKWEVKRRQEQIAQQWSEFSCDTVSTLCDRFHEAANAKQAGGAPAEWNVDDIDLSFAPHPRATIVAAHRLDWPDSLRKSVENAPLMRVRYVRIEQKAQPIKILGYYRRQLPEGDEHPIPNGLWIESLERSAEGRNLRSVDVFLTKASASVPGLLNQEQELTVEILTVECAALAAKGPQ